MDYNSAIKKLFSLHQFGIKLGLDNISKLCEFIGNPQKELKAFHIAGSNGKGSTASFLASILMEEGYKVGLYTSPHFVKFNERIRIDGKEIDDDYIVNFVSELNSYIDQNSPTFFELTTAMAFKYFYENKVDFAVIETGLGGRLDATNIIEPLISIITTISLEHTNVLGDTIQKIAREKAGIIKKGKPVVLGIMPPEAIDSIKEIAEKIGSRVLLLKEIVDDKGEYLRIKNNPNYYNIYQTPLKGKFQLFNAALAIAAINQILILSNGINIDRGIRNVVRNSGIQGRYEIYNNNPLVIFDSAHNPEGVKSFLGEFIKDKKKYTKRILLFGVMRDKNIPEMLFLLREHFDEILITSVNYERAASIEMLQDITKQLKINSIMVKEPEEYIKKFISSNKGNEVLVVLGSMYLLGQVKKMLAKNFNGVEKILWN
ncbi:folylpolyglutamate synthase/dihydrofolate synthase family protein [Melioribacteraceae bacterium 4301-Me]|uniref:bifunctional folylpolyglutamate synthase/dihydrofolate synthase n=1 Tax=Pyranulibacter aquaticus TaxID=3163344 RepID=UPI0035981ABB